jgi:hypothetical protein
VQGKVKLSDCAFNKVINYKGTSKNHWLSQVTNFRPGDPNASKRADDALDTFTSGLCLGLGNGDGF